MKASIRYRPIGFALAGLLGAGILPGIAMAGASESQAVECKLPGEIRSVGGHSMMSAGRIVQTSPDDCRQRGGEYTVQEAPPPMAASPITPATGSGDTRIVSCLLPAQTRQLGEKARYRTTRSTIRTTRSDCQKRGGSVYVRKARTTRRKP